MNSQQRGHPTAGAVDGRRRCATCSDPLAADNTARICARCSREQRDQLHKPPVFSEDDEFWTTDELRSAFESQSIGKVLKVYRHHHRFLAIYGKALNQETLGRWLSLNQAQVSRLEKGKVEQNLEVLRTYAKILHLPQHMLWFDMPGQTRLSTRVDSWNEPLSNSPLLGITAPQSRLLHPLNVGLPNELSSSEDPAVHLHRLIAARSHFEQMYRNSGGLVTGSRIELYLARRTLPMAVMMTSHPDAGEVERRSRRAIGGLIALAGVCAYDSEDWNTANSHFRQALTIAELSRDHSFHAYVIALMVNQAIALEDFKAADALADVGLRSSVQASATSLTVDLQAMKAKALAAMGDNTAAISVIRELEFAIDNISITSGIVEASYVQEVQLRAKLAEALTSLGDLGAAQRYAEQSFIRDDHARGKVNRLASMATLEVARGEIERASLVVCEMVDSAQGMESRRLGSRFAELRAALASRPATVSRDAIDKLDTALMLMP